VQQDDLLKGGEYFMKYISGKDINMGIIFVVLGVVTFVIGISKWPFFILSAIFLGSLSIFGVGFS
jgi:hypothetical protein